MRTLISTLGGIVVALICMFAFAAVTSLGAIELSVCGLFIATLVGYSIHGLPRMRRACVRLRMLRGRLQAHFRSSEWKSPRALWSSLRPMRRSREHSGVEPYRGVEPHRHSLQAAAIQGECADSASSSPARESQPFVASLRSTVNRANPMWISYALVAFWACYEILGVTSRGAAPIETAVVTMPNPGAELAHGASLVESDTSAPLASDAAFVPVDPDAAVSAVMVAGSNDDPLHTLVDTTAPAVARKRSRQDPCHGQVGRCNSVLEKFLARGTEREF